jgi:hypothetical protein
MLRVDPRQQRRLAEIIANLGERIGEATSNGWLGEVKGLQVSLEAAKSKMDRLVKSAATRRSSAVNMGIPAIQSPTTSTESTRR